MNEVNVLNLIIRDLFEKISHKLFEIDAAVGTVDGAIEYLSNPPPQKETDPINDQKVVYGRNSSSEEKFKRIDFTILHGHHCESIHRVGNEFLEVGVVELYGKSRGNHYGKVKGSIRLKDPESCKKEPEQKLLNSVYTYSSDLIYDRIDSRIRELMPSILSGRTPMLVIPTELFPGYDARGNCVTDGIESIVMNLVSIRLQVIFHDIIQEVMMEFGGHLVIRFKKDNVDLYRRLQAI